MKEPKDIMPKYNKTDNKKLPKIQRKSNMKLKKKNCPKPIFLIKHLNFIFKTIEKFNFSKSYNKIMITVDINFFFTK